MPTNYDNSKIYAIRSHQTEEIYIGSTTQTLSRRMAGHRTAYKRFTEGKTTAFYTSFKILSDVDAYVELLEEFPCVNRIELNKREGELIRSMDCVNKNIAGRSQKQYQKQWREHNKDYQKQWHADNKKHADKLNEKHVCPCGGKYTQRNVKQHEKSNKHFDFINLYVV